MTTAYRNISSTSINNHPRPKPSIWFSSSNSSLSEARRSFFLVSIFDFLFMVLLWLIYCTTKGYSLKEAYEEEIVKYDVTVSLFDLVLLSLVRFILLSLIYVLIKLIHWLPITIITFTSSCFLISKVILFALKGTHKIITDYVILILSFVLVWIQVYYLEVKIFSMERKRYEDEEAQAAQAATQQAGHSNRGYGGTSRRAVSDIVSFYSPLDSPNDSDDEQDDIRGATLSSHHQKIIDPIGIDYANLSFNSQIKEYELQAKDLVQRVLSIYNKTDSWKLDKQIDTDTRIYTQGFSKIGKVFKLEATIKHNENAILKVLRDDVNDYPLWNKSVKETHVLASYPDYLSIVYSLVFEQVNGLVASRDFVNITKYVKQDGLHVLAGAACAHTSKPPVENIVRGENGPTAYFIKPINERTCRITWILNVNLKGWLPQYLIDQSLSTVQLDFISSLTDRLNQLTNSYNE